MRRPVCALFAGALGAQLIAAFEPQVTLGPLAAFFVAVCLGVWVLGGPSRGYGPCLLAGAVLGMAFTARTQARLEEWTQRYDGALVRLTGCVEDVRERYSHTTLRARIRGETVGGEEVQFCCWCDDLPVCAAGDEIEGVFTLASPASEARPGWYADEVVFLAGYQRQFEVLGEGKGFRAWSARLQQTLSGALCQELEEDEAGTLAAMVVGDRTRISEDLNQAYRAAGLSHVLVVSGMHVSILCGMGLPRLWNPARWLLGMVQKLMVLLPGNLGAGLYRKWMVRAARNRFERTPAGQNKVLGFWKRWRSRVLTLWPVALAVLLTGITGFTPSVLRASTAVVIGAVGVWVLAPTDALTNLAIAGLGMSSFNSYAVCDVGFQLSYAAVVGTLAGVELSRRRNRQLHDRPALQRRRMQAMPLVQRLGLRISRAVWSAACVSFCATAATFPVLVIWGMGASPYALVSGVVILWVVQPLMTLGILAALTGLVPALYPIYHLLTAGAGALARLLNGWAVMVSGWPGTEIRFDSRYAAVVSLIWMGLCWLAWHGKVRARFWVPALALAVAVGIGGALLLSRDVVQVALVGNAQTPSVILAQNGRAVVLYRGGSGGRTAVEDWLTGHGIPEADFVVDLRREPSRVTLPPAHRVITPARMGDYADHDFTCGAMEVEVLSLPSGCAVRVTVDRWQLAAVSGTFELASPVSVDWLLASPSDPSAFQWDGVLALGEYDWMEEDTARAEGLVLRPGGDVKTRG